jgi:hypothetical protein
LKRLLDDIMARHGVTLEQPRGIGAPVRLSSPARGRATSLAEQDPIGQPGTIIRDGDIYAEPTSRYRPTYVRGYSGDHGLYEEHYRSEPLIFDAVQSHTETLVQGQVQLQAPAEIDESMRERVEDFVAFHNAKLASMPGGWPGFIESAGSCLIYAFATFNVVYGGVGPGERTYIHALRYYEPSTIDKWCFDERLHTLLGVQYRTTGDGESQWYVPALGESVTDRRLLLVNLNARGNNVEGISPLRPTIFYVKAKQLLMQIAMVAAEKYGIPIAVVREVVVPPGSGSRSIEDDADTIYRALKYQQAVDAHVAKLPAGLDIEFKGPQGQMPTYGDLIAYCDQMIATTFSVEGSLLGLQQAVGSYALGEVKERDALRSAPYYARRILAPLNEIIRELAISELGEMDEYPKLVWRMDTATDDGAWLERATQVFGGPIDTWPKAAQAVALEMLDLPPDTFDSTEEQQEEPETPTGSLGLASCGHDHLTLTDRTPGALELAEVDGLESIMDATEAALAADLARIQRDMRDEWRVLIRDNETAADLIADRRALRDRFEPIILAAVVDAMREAAERAGGAYLDALGATGSYTLDVDGEIEMLAVGTADEALNRMVGNMTASEVERARGGRRLTIPLLAASTLAIIAARVTSSAINRARDRVVSGLVDAARERGASIGRVVATRSAVLDSRTCSECRKLDGRKAAVGSAAYRDLTPPNRCLGRERCRCVWIYQLDYDALARAGVISEQAAAERLALDAVREDT